MNMYLPQSFLSLLHSVQSLPNALKSSKPSTTGRESVSSHKSSKNAGQKRKLTALDEIRLVSVYLATYIGWTVLVVLYRKRKSTRKRGTGVTTG